MKQLEYKPSQLEPTTYLYLTNDDKQFAWMKNLKYAGVMDIKCSRCKPENIHETLSKSSLRRL